METSDPALARTTEAQVLASHAAQLAAEIRSFAARHSQIAAELWDLARHPHRIDDAHQSRLVVERLQRQLDETDARSQQLTAMSDKIEARRRELVALE